MPSVERSVRRTIALALAGVLLIGGCGARVDPGVRPPDPDEPVVGPPASGTPAPRPSPEILEPRDDLVEVQSHVWRKAIEVSPGRLLVTFYGGVKECFGVDRVEVQEKRRVVIVTLFTGRVPSAEVCIEIAVFQGVVVQLDEPLGDRAVRDGA